MTDAAGPSNGNHGLPPAAAGAPRTLLGRWFEPVHVGRDAARDLQALAERGSLVFVMRSAGLLNFLYLRWFLRRSGLPPLRAAQGFRGDRISALCQNWISLNT